MKLNEEDKQIRVSLMLPPEMKAELTAIGASLGLSLNSVIRIACYDYLNSMERQADSEGAGNESG